MLLPVMVVPVFLAAVGFLFVRRQAQRRMDRHDGIRMEVERVDRRKGADRRKGNDAWRSGSY